MGMLLTHSVAKELLSTHIMAMELLLTQSRAI